MSLEEERQCKEELQVRDSFESRHGKFRFSLIFPIIRLHVTRVFIRVN